MNLAAYGAPDISDLAASYALAMTKNHTFVDGKKRAAFLAVGLFCALNAHRLVATQVDATQTMIGVAAGDIGEAAFAAWLRSHLQMR